MPTIFNLKGVFWISYLEICVAIPHMSKNPSSTSQTCASRSGAYASDV